MTGGSVSYSVTAADPTSSSTVSQVLGSGIDPYQLNENGRLYFDIGKDKNGRDVAINVRLP